MGKPSEIAGWLKALRAAGWKIEPGETPLPESIQQRYPWFPEPYRLLATAVRSLCSANETAWFLTAADYAGTSGGAFAWNEWELLSLDAARDDEPWRREITVFWDRHLPISFSVKSGYAYWAIDRETLAIVAGQEPDFEEVVPAAASLDELFELLASRGPQVADWL